MNAETVVNNGESYMKQYINKEITWNEMMDKIYNDMNNMIYDAIVEEL
jgi:hypothetical protein